MPFRPQAAIAASWTAPLSARYVLTSHSSRSTCWPAAADAGPVAQLVADLVREDVPVAGRCLGLGPVGPELDHHPHEVALVDDVGGVRLAGDRVDVVPAAVVRAQRVVAPGPWEMSIGAVLAGSSRLLSRMTSTAWSL